MAHDKTLSPRWLNVAKRLQQIAQSGNGGNAKISVVIIVDGQSQPRHFIVDRQQIEPKSASLDWLLSLADE